MEKLYRYTVVLFRTICMWLFAILVFLSFTANVWMGSVLYTHEQVMKESADYLRYRDSMDLEFRDRMIDKEVKYGK